MLVLGCGHTPTPSYKIEKQVLHTKKSEQGSELFAFIVTVLPTPMMKIDGRKAMTRGELKRFSEYERLEDSPELKLALEDDAITLLEKKLEEDAYCQLGYKVNQVFWRQRSVQLRGECL
jgi:hypothetical protein